MKQTDLIGCTHGVMFFRYFSMQATEPLKFGSKTRIQIESNICLGNGRPSSSCFEAARLMALRILEQVRYDMILKIKPRLLILNDKILQQSDWR